MARKKAEERNQIIPLVVKPMTWYVAVYIRLSREDGEDISASVREQKKKITEYIKKSVEHFVIVDFYIDDGLSGTDDTREEFQRMILDIERKKVNCVIVKDLSRCFRNYADQGHYLEYYFVLHNIRFISLELPALDSYKDPVSYNSFMVPMQGVVNDNHCRETSLKIRSTFKAKRERGEFIGAFAPYGYKKDTNDKNKLVIDEEVSDVVRDIFNWYIGGMSIRGICFKLNELGIPNPSQYKKNNGYKYQHPYSKQNDGMWSHKTISSILKNEMYIGNMVQGRNRIKSYKVHKQISTPKEEWFIVENTHEPIISKKDFSIVQDLLKRDTRTSPSKHKTYLFSGLLYCADCKKAMHRTSSKERVYYICSTHKNKSKKACTKHTINEAKLKDVVLKAIQLEIAKVGNLKEIISKINQEDVINKNTERIEKLLKNKYKDKEKITLLIDSLYLDWKNGDITKEQFHRLRESTELQEKQVEKAIENLKKEKDEIEDMVDKDNPYFTYFLKHHNIKELDRRILIELIDKIYIFENKEITIQYKFQNELEKIISYIEKN